MNSSLLSVLKQASPKARNLWFASTLSGLLMWIAWPVGLGAPLLFIAWIPLLWIEHQTRNDGRSWRFFLLIFWSCLIWNLGTTWWMYYSTAVGSVVAIAANAMLMTIPWVLLRKTSRLGGSYWGYLGWVLYWCAFEHIHLTWEISWPWLTLGNGFAMFPQWIQWYEYTGVFGGTLWILLINLGMFSLVWGQAKKFKSILILTILGLALPIGFSYLMYANYEEQGDILEVVAVQPNIDPYTEKFIDSENFIAFEQQVDRFIQLSQQEITPLTSFVLWPESAIDGGFEELALLSTDPNAENRSLQAKDLRSIQKIKAFKNKHAQLSLLTGLTSYTIYGQKSDATITARSNGEFYYDVYNTAYYLGDDGSLHTYHKSKLVPGPETMPYPKVLGFLSDLLVDFGGTSGQLGKQAERTVFINSQGYGLAPSICYESIYGGFMAEYVRNGAHIIGIITNDGWWKDSPGHKQHLHYAVIRAIENRRAVARSANTGISAFITQKGKIVNATNFWEQDVIKAELRANTQLTFYSKHGDYLGRTSVWLAILVGLSAWVRRLTSK